MNYDAFEAFTSDAVGNPKFPHYIAAPTDPDAAAAGDPFVHFICRRGNPGERLVRFWCPQKPSGPVLRVDAEPLVDSYDGTPASLKATCQLVAITFFYYHTNGFYQSEGVTTLDIRDVRTGERLAGPHP
ncbi:MAG: hypothetical protein AAF645_20700 [Myxococcota bacterium]